MLDGAKKITPTGDDQNPTRALPMPPYQYQQSAPAKGDVRGQLSSERPVESRKIKSLQNLSFAS